MGDNTGGEAAMLLPLSSKIFFLSNVLVDFVVLPPGHGRSVTDF